MFGTLYPPPHFLLNPLLLLFENILKMLTLANTLFLTLMIFNVFLHFFLNCVSGFALHSINYYLYYLIPQQHLNWKQWIHIILSAHRSVSHSMISKKLQTGSYENEHTGCAKSMVTQWNAWNFLWISCSICTKIRF